MVLAFANAILLGLLVDGPFGAAAFVALLGFTAGLWISQSIHSLGSAPTSDYDGVLNELVDVGGAKRTNRQMYRFGRLLTLVAAVTAVALLTSAQVLSGGVVAIGAIAVVTGIVGFITHWAPRTTRRSAERTRISRRTPTRSTSNRSGATTGTKATPKRVPDSSRR